jgi:hypothetical protein
MINVHQDLTWIQKNQGKALCILLFYEVEYILTWWELSGTCQAK